MRKTIRKTKKTKTKTYELEACLVMTIPEDCKEAVVDYIMNAVIDVVEQYSGMAGGGITLFEVKASNKKRGL